ncbi:MAG: methionine biosynthesis protein MetW [Patescibacteria group bacterium]
MKNFYEEYWQIRGKSGSRPRYNIFSEWIENGSSVLDIGCGDGSFGEFLVQKNGVDYTGCDISKAALEIAEKRGLKTRYLAIDETIDFPDKSFDYIIMSEFLEHIVNSEEVLADAMRIAKKGVMVSIPNTAYWKFRLELLLGKFPKQWAIAPKEHLRYWSVKDFERTINMLGFKVKRIKSSNGRKPLRDWWPNLFGLQICFYVTE